MPKAKSVAITPAVHEKMQVAVDYLNQHLFDGELPDAFLVFQRQAHSGGHFSPDRYLRRDARDSRRHEINLNPDHFVGETDDKIVSTLAHEMTHLWQHVCVKPVKSGYHDAKWGAKMKAIGLYPSSTRKPGGKETGFRMSHYIVTGRRFAEVFASLAKTGWRLDLESAQCAGKRAGPDSKTKFTCSSCGAKAWGKPESADRLHSLRRADGPAAGQRGAAHGGGRRRSDRPAVVTKSSPSPNLHLSSKGRVETS